MHTTYCNFKQFLNLLHKIQIAIHKNYFALQIHFLHRSFAIQNFWTKSFPDYSSINANHFK